MLNSKDWLLHLRFGLILIAAFSVSRAYAVREWIDFQGAAASPLYAMDPPEPGPADDVPESSPLLLQEE